MNKFNPSLLEKLGSEFHLIMQQIGLGLPVELFFKAYPQIDKWIEAAKPFLDIPGSKQWNTEAQYLFLKLNYELPRN
ncbi:MAG: hypothetical protein KME30_14085 [Iphinoe sp. HA4291-MV1]|jgi:hypothetical protein|nr:hypothetical protein [Iphinoe sp. HA4291-MV1]